MGVQVQKVGTKSFAGQKPGTSGLRKRVPEFQQEHYTENFVQAVLDGGLGSKKKGSTLVVGGDGRFLCKEAVNAIIQISAANGLSRLVVGQDGFLSTPAVSSLIRNLKVDGGIILTASHNPGGPKGDFGIKFNCDNGGPAPDHITDAIYKITTEISSYSICRDVVVDTGVIGHYEFDIEGSGKFVVDVIDSVEDYVELMKSIFDFPAIREYIKSGSGGSELRVLIDSMHGATGPYVSTIFNDLLGCNGSDLLRTVPKPDFGGCHPDPNLTYAKDLVDRLKVGEVDMGAAFDGDGDRNMILGKNAFFVCPSDSLAVIANHIQCIPYFKNRNVVGFARSMPTAAAVDLVAKKKGLQAYETPTGWKYFGNLMDDGRIALCGEESFGTGSIHIREKDGIWALLAWLQILSVQKKSVETIVREHWAEYGRNVFTRYDYENVESGGANLLMTFLEASVNASKGKELSANGVTYKVALTDNFEYTDPVDGSIAKKQGLRVIFEDGSRLVFRLSGTGSAGATIRLYVDSYVSPDDKTKLNASAQDLLRPLVLIALDLCKMEQFTGRKAPTVIT
ncbi:hypothetical protein PFISCL1PPCAC_6153 [Pristionchus fissidentatus]|uniref:phosphoglucomutase (alpha-D-glucose-1,6-bisphosphate-dependent) n=1 Tax=Pristionchus fissidentatus TaxID=1538716 RepID=A0AAV5V815_9BILA|nr:hypothetical protein PFISCL1PPCAC_6153 [Pristionchus fissidentatus]